MEEKYNRLIEIFKELSSVPRNSKKEEKIGNYILDFARNLGLEAYMDELYNVVVIKEASSGENNKRKIIFQAHTDMVCEKTQESNHDFENDPIDIIIDGDKMKANGTTLGADDGIGVATLLLLMEDTDIKLPQTYFFFTTQEEIGMYGARALDTSKVDADYLINLDGEEENTAIVGCAGGVSVHYEKNGELEDIKNPVYSLEISGLYGGHSGVDIDKGRINSNVLAAKILENTGSKIVSFVGGNKDNAIPNYTKVVFENENNIEEKIGIILDTLDVCEEDKNIKVELEEIENKKYKSFSLDDSNSIVSLLLNLKQNVIKMSKDINGLVETSGNIGIVKVEKGNVHIVESLRSSIDSEKEKIKNENNEYAKSLGMEIREEGEYPGWKYNPNSNLEPLYKKAYMETHSGQEPIICAIHAGVECGMFYEKMPNLDMISLGPDVVDVHTVNETLYLESCKRLLKTLYKMIDNLE